MLLVLFTSLRYNRGLEEHYYEHDYSSIEKENNDSHLTVKIKTQVQITSMERVNVVEAVGHE